MSEIERRPGGAGGSGRDRDPGRALARDLSLFDITMIGLGAMIGAGIFVLIGHAAGEAGPAVTLTFALNGVIATVVGLAYAELGAAMPHAGGAYAWFQAGTRPVLGFFSGWISWFAHAVACSLYALGFASFTVSLVERLWGVETLPGARWLHPALSVGVVALFVYINHRGASETGLAENIVTSLKVLILLLLIVFGLRAVFDSPAPLEPFTPFLPEGLLGVGVAMGLTFIAFEGYEIIAQSGEEVVDPGRNIPRAILISIAAAVSLYVLVAFVLIGGVSPPGEQTVHGYLGALGELGIVRAAGQLMPYGRVVLLIAGMASTMSALNATVYSSSRVAFAMGRDGHLPPAFGRVHGANETPDFAILVSGAIIVGMALTLPIRDVAASADIMFLLLFVGVNYLVIRYRRTRAEMERPFRMPGVPWLPALVMVAGIGLAVTLVQLSVAAWITAGLWFALGAAVYVGYSRVRPR